MHISLDEQDYIRYVLQSCLQFDSETTVALRYFKMQVKTTYKDLGIFFPRKYLQFTCQLLQSAAIALLIYSYETEGWTRLAGMMEHSLERV